ncbi:MAG: CocE/NonD family hydrolase [Actinobacteria bacterium]|nr:CocE/NonD family hydrolase [Actinomycetota bacterium]
MKATRTTLLVLLVLAVGLVGFVPATQSTQPSQQQEQMALRDDADWSEHYFPSYDGITNLHADVLRPKGLDLTDTNPTPVILTVSPYTNHNGSTLDVDPFGEGPNPRFYDFLDLSGALTKGYTYVMVDLPGNGGSGGCNDWGGEREQGAVRAAVEWAASQPWSTGKVALLGKSYDGWTGLMGIDEQPDGLAAVLSLEPVYSGYKYIFMNGVQRPNWLLTIGLFQAIDAKPGRPSDTPQYHVNGAPQGYCYATNIGLSADNRENSDYWTERDLLRTTSGKNTPLFLTQGFLETNTRSDGAFQYFNGLTATQNRAWYGQFDHCRAWETQAACDNPGSTQDSPMAVGRADFIEQAMRFLDEHLKGVEPPIDDPAIEVQDILGRWRAEQAWPPADAVLYGTELNAGSYTDNGSGSGLSPSASQGVWTISQPLPHAVWLSGEPTASINVDTVPNANVTVNVYDIGPDGRTRMISRGTSLVRGTVPGQRNVSFTMYGQDWPIPAGHRIGVLVSSANSEEYRNIGTRQTVDVLAGSSITLPFLTFERDEFVSSDGTTPRLQSFMGSGTSLPAGLIDSAQRDFNLPAPLQER